MLRLGTRASLLARTQSTIVAGLVEKALGEPCELVPIRTDGDDPALRLDAPSRPGIFVATLREALLAGSVDLVVHSFKDLPSAPVPGLVVAAVPERGDPADVLVATGDATLAQLPPRARVGTSSPRRAAALLRARPDLRVEPVRGNIDTRLGLVSSGTLDAIVLAKAGLDRIGRAVPQAALLDPTVMLPAPAQGALAVECRLDGPLAALLATLDHSPSRCAVTAERAVLQGVEAACTTAVGAHAQYAAGILELRADLSGHRGVAYVQRYAALALPDSGDLAAAHQLGLDVAAALLDGAGR